MNAKQKYKNTSSYWWYIVLCLEIQSTNETFHPGFFMTHPVRLTGSTSPRFQVYHRILMRLKLQKPLAYLGLLKPNPISYHRRFLDQKSLVALLLGPLIHLTCFWYQFSTVPVPVPSIKLEPQPVQVKARKRKSRWGDADETSNNLLTHSVSVPNFTGISLGIMFIFSWYIQWYLGNTVIAPQPGFSGSVTPQETDDNIDVI